MDKITSSDWANACRHVLDVEKSYWKKDNICDIEIPQIFKLAEDSDSDSDSDAEEH